MNATFLGQKWKSIKVDEFASPCDWTAHVDTPLSEIIEKMDQNSYRHVPVTDHNRPVGIISQRDIQVLKALHMEKNYVARDIMSDDPFCVTGGQDLDDVAYDMSEKKIGSAIVTDDHGDIQGIFTTTDALNALIEILRGQ